MVRTGDRIDPVRHLVAGACAVVFCVSVSPVFAQTLRIYHIDVEQADATLLITPSGKTLLVDSGKNGHVKRIKAVMDTAGVSRIDAFVATHYHEDHYGGIDDLVKLGIPVLSAFDRENKECCLPASKKEEPTFQGYQTAVGLKAVSTTTGTTSYCSMRRRSSGTD